VAGLATFVHYNDERRAVPLGAMALGLERNSFIEQCCYSTAVHHPHSSFALESMLAGLKYSGNL
jgi:hypothetical protein